MSLFAVLLQCGCLEWHIPLISFNKTWQEKFEKIICKLNNYFKWSITGNAHIWTCVPPFKIHAQTTFHRHNWLHLTMLLLFIVKHKPSMPAERGEVPHVQGILQTSPQQHALKPKATTGDTMHYTSQSNSQQQHWGVFWGRKGLHLILPYPQNKAFSASNFLSGSQTMEKQSAGVHPNTVLQPPLLTDKSEREHSTLSISPTSPAAATAATANILLVCIGGAQGIEELVRGCSREPFPKWWVQTSPKSCSQGK